MNNEDKDLTKKDDKLQRNDFHDITQRNWLMLKEIEKGKTIQEAYRNAGYGGEYSSAYQLYSKLKKKLEMVYEADNVDSLRLKIAAKKILDMQVQDRPVKPEVHLKAIETLAKLTDKQKGEVKVISPFIIFKSPGDDMQASVGKVIDVDAETDLEKDLRMNVEEVKE